MLAFKVKKVALSPSFFLTYNITKTKKKKQKIEDRQQKGGKLQSTERLSETLLSSIAPTSTNYKDIRKIIAKFIFSFQFSLFFTQIGSSRAKYG